MPQTVDQFAKSLIAAGLAPKRSCRHLDTMHYEAVLRARVARSRCSVKTAAVPWADKHSRFNRTFEASAPQVLNAASNVKRAAEVLEFDSDSLHGIIERDNQGSGVPLGEQSGAHLNFTGADAGGGL